VMSPILICFILVFLPAFGRQRTGPATNVQARAYTHKPGLPGVKPEVASFGRHRRS
jgi:hypothetical protein